MRRPRAVAEELADGEPVIMAIPGDAPTSDDITAFADRLALVVDALRAVAAERSAPAPGAT